jgi:hypothetical protein
MWVEQSSSHFLAIGHTSAFPVYMSYCSGNRLFRYFRVFRKLETLVSYRIFSVDEDKILFSMDMTSGSNLQTARCSEIVVPIGKTTRYSLSNPECKGVLYRQSYLLLTGRLRYSVAIQIYYWMECNDVCSGSLPCTRFCYTFPLSET